MDCYNSSCRGGLNVFNAGKDSSMWMAGYKEDYDAAPEEAFNVDILGMPFQIEYSSSMFS